jgi:TetR/AcrR family transcriptional regulator
MADKTPRRQLILQARAAELETNPGARITTAAVARAAGVSEAALYRHFASKAQMFEGLIAFAEESVFARVNQILADQSTTRERCSRVLYLLLGFAARNPGITRVLLGDALVGETGRLLTRADQFFARIETQLKQILREARLRRDAVARCPEDAAANLMLAWAEGRMHQYLRSRFRLSPLHQWEQQWQALESGLFEPTGGQRVAP